MLTSHMLERVSNQRLPSASSTHTPFAVFASFTPVSSDMSPASRACGQKCADAICLRSSITSPLNLFVVTFNTSFFGAHVNII